MNKNILYPNAYFKNVLEITIDFLNENKIKGLILDVDNTLIDYNRNMLNGLEKWAEHMKQNNIKLYILSNSNKKDKVSYIANKLNIEYSYFAKKPFKAGFNRVKEILKLSSENIAVVGDQIFTDVLGGNRCKMFTILVEPLGKKDIWITQIKRPIEIENNGDFSSITDWLRFDFKNIDHVKAILYFKPRSLAPEDDLSILIYDVNNIIKNLFKLKKIDKTDLEILDMIRSEYTLTEIAKELNFSGESNVRYKLNNIAKKITKYAEYNFLDL